MQRIFQINVPNSYIIKIVYRDKNSVEILPLNSDCLEKIKDKANKALVNLQSSSVYFTSSSGEQQKQIRLKFASTQGGYLNDDGSYIEKDDKDLFEAIKEFIPEDIYKQIIDHIEFVHNMPIKPDGRMSIYEMQENVTKEIKRFSDNVKNYRLSSKTGFSPDIIPEKVKTHILYSLSELPKDYKKDIIDITYGINKDLTVTERYKYLINKGRDQIAKDTQQNNR